MHEGLNSLFEQNLLHDWEVLRCFVGFYRLKLAQSSWFASILENKANIALSCLYQSYNAIKISTATKFLQKYQSSNYFCTWHKSISVCIKSYNLPIFSFSFFTLYRVASMLFSYSCGYDKEYCCNLATESNYNNSFCFITFEICLYTLLEMIV